jgi:hypothetical protein
MNTYSKTGGTAPHLKALATDGGECSASRPDCFVPREELPEPEGWEAGWASDPVWATWRGELILFARDRTPNVQHVALLLPKILGTCSYGFK